MRLIVSLLVLLFSPALAAQPPAPEQPPLISRAVLFGNADRSQVRLSPDGTQISYLAAVDGVLNVFVGPVQNPAQARPVTRDTNRGIRQYFWAFTSGHIIYLQDSGGDENWRLHAVDLATNTKRDLTPFDNVQARLIAQSPERPRELLIGINNRDPAAHDLYIVDITTGTLTPRQACPPGFLSFDVDSAWNVRAGITMTNEGGLRLMTLRDGAWAQGEEIPMEDALTTAPSGYSADDRVRYWRDSRLRDTSALFAEDTATGARTLLAEHAQADLAEVITHPRTQRVQAAAFNHLRLEWKILDESIRADLEYLAKVDPGELTIASRTLDDSAWLVAYLSDTGPTKFYLYTRGEQKRAQFLFVNRENLVGLPLAEMHPTTIPTRDGMEMVSYLTLPVGTRTGPGLKTRTPLPMVLLVHGGPWARDEWGYDPIHQMLANRGYAVLSVNFRGSTGFGKRFTNAGNLEWGAKMHDDLIDAVQWAVRENIADAKRVAIMGGSYGGYATLVGLTFTPDTFAAGVNIVGVSNLVTLLNTIPPYWKPLMGMWQARVGDPLSPEGRRFLRSRSPITHVEEIKRPLLIGHGANDPRVKVAESDQIVEVMQKKNLPVTYVVFPDEGHGFARPENNMAFFAITEAFLSTHLGGRFEPIGDAITPSSADIRAGAEFVPGLKK
jgi:dipeptidyl aminopeptidase/acylaminoacyl peptidase